MDDEIRKYYEKVKDVITEEEFEERLEACKKANEHISFMDEKDCANQVVSELTPDEVKKENADKKVNNDDYYVATKIADLKETDKSDQTTAISGRVISISNPKVFKNNKGKEGQLANVELADDTGKIRATFWSINIKLLKLFNEGDIVQINNVGIRHNDYSGNLEASLRTNSTIKKLNPDDYPDFPKYEEEITEIGNITPDDETVNVIARITRIPAVRSYEKNGKEGKVASLELKDETGEITYTLWNNNVYLIKTLGLEDGDTVKILAAQVRQDRDGNPTLSHWDGRIVKGDYDLPDFSNPITKIADVQDGDDVDILGVITRIQDAKTFTRNDGSEGKLRSFEVTDETGSIRVTLWGDQADLPITKGEIVKILGGKVRFDEYYKSGYSLNTNFNTQIALKPSDISTEDEVIFDEIREQMQPVSIGELQEFDEDGEEVDVVGRVISVYDINEFQRDDGSVGIVRTVDFADETGEVSLALWADKAEYELDVGEAYRIENARTKLGMHSVDLNIGSTSRIIKLTEDEAYMLPSFETLENMIYTTKTIDEIDEDDEFEEGRIRVIGRIFEVNEPHEFERQNGDKGVVRNLEIADMTGSIKLVLWDNDALKDLEVGGAIKVENPNVRYNDNDNRIELQSGRSTSIMTPTETEISTLPSMEELEDLIYQSRTIGSLQEDDVNIRVSGILREPSNSKILLTKCPHCNNSIEEFGEDEYVCDYCGEEIEEPRHILMIPARLEDEDGESISITFFNKLAEELIGMTTEDIVELINEYEDPGVLEGKIDDLDGMNIEVIANVNFDEYNEEMRLNPKKILSKSY